MTRTKAGLPGGSLELAVLGALWARNNEPSTARAIYPEVGEPRELAYTTITKVLDRLVEKRMVRRRRARGLYAYRAVAKREPTERALARAMIEQIIADDPRPAVAALLGALEDVSPDLLGELEAQLAARRRHSNGT